MNEGWQCPCCGRGVAPHVATCDHGGRPLDAISPGIPDTGKINIGPFVYRPGQPNEWRSGSLAQWAVGLCDTSILIQN